MRWISKALELLKSEFEDRSFTGHDAIRFLTKKGYAEGTVYRILHDLTRDRKVERLGRGIFRISHPKSVSVTTSESLTISDHVTAELIPGPLTKARKVLEKRGVEYMVTGPSALMRYHHYIPRRLLHLVYVIKGSGEPTVSYLKEAGLRALLDPTRAQLELALENFAERDLFIVREFSELEGNNKGISSIEKATVDSYYESTRNYIPYPEEEVGRIAERVFRSENVNLSSLLWLAARRGIRGEIISLVRYLRPDIEIHGAKRNKFVEKVLGAIKEGER